jgi:hypothetical protein
MSSTVPPYQVQSLISTVFETHGRPTSCHSSFNTAHFLDTDNVDAVLSVEVKCVQAFGTCCFRSERTPSSLVSSCCQTDVFSGSEIYVGCSNGEVLLFALQANGPDQVRSGHRTTSSSHHTNSTQPESYTLVTRQVLPTGKAVDEIVLTPSISKALALSGKNVHDTLPYASDFGVDRQIFFFVIPSLELVAGIKPIRNVMAFAVDHRHIVRPIPSMDSPMPFLPIDFSVVKRSGIVLYSLRESLKYIKVGHTLPSSGS